MLDNANVDRAAPGTISIRGWALKTPGGDGVVLQINQGSTKIWGPEALGANDQAGFATGGTATGQHRRHDRSCQRWKAG